MSRALLLLLALVSGAARAGSAQFAPPGTGGAAELGDLLQRLGAAKRVLVIGAHPDDEDTQLLVWLSRGRGADAAYLSLTRGEGGQNLIGTELGPELGLIRTEELLAARRIDGASQFFSRAYDFGFSKSADEAFRFWPRDSVLADVLAVIRRFRPQVIVSVFSGTPRDGHGQHQVAGILARQAFAIAKDSSWGPVKLYSEAFFDTAATTLRIPAGDLDPLLGFSYHQLAMLGRSQHRSQNMGQLEDPGFENARASWIRLAYVAGRGAGPDTALFQGVDTLFRGDSRYVALIDSARAAFTPYAPGRVAPYLARAAALLGPADSLERATLDRALLDAAGVALDGYADDGIVVPGERMQVEAKVWNAGAGAVHLDDVALETPPGWTSAGMDLPSGPVAPGQVLVRRFVANVGARAARSEPYFLARPLAGALYDWSGVPAAVRGLPFAPPALVLRLRLTVAGVPVTVRREVVYRYRDEALGEVRKPVFVTDPFDVTVTPGLVVWPLAPAAARQFTVTVTNRSRGRATARVRVLAPVEWGRIPEDTLEFTHEDESKSYTFTVAPPAGAEPGTVWLRAEAVGSDGTVSAGALHVIDYPHITAVADARPSTVEVRLARLALPALAHVGYVRGASDRVPEALEAVGVPVTLLDVDSLARGDLSHFDAIVVGSRAYEVDPALVANNGRLLDYARNGGLLIVQYQEYPYVDGRYAPYPFTIARPHDRVTDETAAVTVLDSTAALWHVPNAIGPADWDGWVQDRGLYFAHQWDSTYTPMLTMHDPGEAPLAGGLLVAPLGRGRYVYTGLAFFRELPAGVVGAYRLFANLLALAPGAGAH